MLFSRIIVAVIFIPLLVVAVFLRGPFLLAVVIAATALGCAELSWMFQNRQVPVPTLATVLVGLAHLVSVAYGGDGLWPWLASALLAAAALGATEGGQLLTRARGLAVSLVGGTYIGLLSSYALRVVELPPGPGWGILVLMGAWAADTGGFFVGGRFGRHLFAPAVSPRKTWEGVAGSLLLAAVAVALATFFLPIPPEHILPLSLAITIAAVSGDLLESVVKRYTGVKNASKLLGGHGGYLDRMDSLLPVLFVIHEYAVRFAG